MLITNPSKNYLKIENINKQHVIEIKEKEDTSFEILNDGQPIGGGSGNSLWESGTGNYSIQTKDTGCHAKGKSSVAEGEMSFTGVTETIEDWREGKASHAEGGNTTAAGNYSHTEGNSTVTNNPYEHAEGLFNYSHYSQPIYPDAGNTIHSVGIGSNISNRKNAIEIMQNGDTYLYGVGNYNGSNVDSASTLQSVINAGSGGSSLITVVEGASLHYENSESEDDADSWFEARIPAANFPNDFLTNLHKYNLITKVYATDEYQTTLTYTANHFCTQSVAEGGQFFGFCYDEVKDGLDISHMSRLIKQEDAPQYQFQYVGLLGGSRQLPTEGSKVSIYLQKLS